MHHFPRFFSHSKTSTNECPIDPKKRRRRPRLDRRNAAKHIDYDASSFASSLDDSPSVSSSSLVTRSLDFQDRTSFRIEGNEGDMDRICRSLGFNGPEDFAIPEAAWEAMKRRSASDLLPRVRGLRDDEDGDGSKAAGIVKDESDVCAELLDRVRIEEEDSAESVPLNRSGVAGGIRGVRPPSMNLPQVSGAGSNWDTLREFGPENGRSLSVAADRVLSSDEERDEGEERVESKVEEEEDEGLVRIGVTAVMSESCSFTTSNDDDSSSTTTEPMSNISPNGRYTRIITEWDKGALLGRGSFGSVYEGISHDGFFFAIKEVSLLDQGSQGRQSVYQLEQEIALLSKFEHENIVQYYGTDKDASNLYIFLELVTKGSLMSLYQTYNLKDSQVSAYTRQILHGLKYLHDRDVVHRDIKCANILVDANGSVKLADFGLAKVSIPSNFFSVTLQELLKLYEIAFSNAVFFFLLQATKLNDVKSCKGTAFWMAPEVVNGKSRGYGLPADIWSLGCTVLEMLTRQIPYSDLECQMTALFKIGRGIPPTVSDSLSNDARDFILKCLQVNPADRPTAAQLLDHPFVKPSFPTSSFYGSPRPGRRHH
ncbi:Mitogen-activated protein kinase kinase kinase 1 [Linum perenne]